MKNLIFLALLITGTLSIKAQANKTDQLQDLEKSNPAYKNITTATLKSSSRLFGAKDDLTTVIQIIPSGSIVSVIDSDSTYLHVVFEENEGYIFRRHAIIVKTVVNTSPPIQPKQEVKAEQSVQEQDGSRFSYLENKYGTNMAARLMAGKIWKGMNAEMVTDSWGAAKKINREVSGSVIKEEWIFKNTWLYFENNTLLEWGPIRN